MPDPHARPADMMERFERLHGARPFTPFRIETASPGFDVAQPNHAAVTLDGDALVVMTTAGPRTIPASEITRIEIRSRRADMTPLTDIELLVFDFDGVWSNNQVLVMQDGTEGVLCNRSDGLGLELLRKSGMQMLVLSKEQNPVVAARCWKVKVECIQGIDDKLAELTRLTTKRGITLKQSPTSGTTSTTLPA
jgi:hypothetical protein